MLILTSILLIGVAGIVLQSKQDFRFTGFINLLLFFSVGLYLLQDLSEESKTVMYSLIAIVALNFIASKFELLGTEPLAK